MSGALGMTTPLTVAELISKLEKLDPTLHVASTYDGGCLTGAQDVHVGTTDAITDDMETIRMAIIDETSGYELDRWIATEGVAEQAMATTWAPRRTLSPGISG